jgi:hypothetical protein
MKKIALSVVAFGMSVVPALAGDGGAGDMDTGRLLIQAVGQGCSTLLDGLK